MMEGRGGGGGKKSRNSGRHKRGDRGGGDRGRGGYRDRGGGDGDTSPELIESDIGGFAEGVSGGSEGDRSVGGSVRGGRGQQRGRGRGAPPFGASPGRGNI